MSFLGNLIWLIWRLSNRSWLYFRGVINLPYNRRHSLWASVYQTGFCDVSAFWQGDHRHRAGWWVLANRVQYPLGCALRLGDRRRPSDSWVDPGGYDRRAAVHQTAFQIDPLSLSAIRA